ncbi:MAG: transposase [Akkermansiaceae bacterium]|nr:transposase [Akkermansiaceae bacterium]
MRQPRFLSPSAESTSSLYHCISRVVDRQFVLGREEKDVFVRMMREYEAFCGVRVLSYCVMSNHFHLLVEVPPKEKGAAVDITDEDFLARLKPMYSKVYYRGIEQMLERFRADGADAAASELKEKFSCRMHDLSEFMKGLKQRFTQWYNGAHGRRGTLWEGRFKSVLVEDGYAARVMSAYIDLNPVRAGMVDRPEDYRWCSYGVAMQPKAGRGRKLAREGYCRMLAKNTELGNQSPKMLEWGDGVAECYRMMLFADGEEVFVAPFAEAMEARDDIHSGVAPEARKPKIVRKGFKRKDVEQVLAKGGKLSVGEALRCKVRYFSDGMTFGSRDFVNNVFKHARERFGEKRKSGARPLKGVGWQKTQTRLYSMRQLVKEPLE